MLSNEKFRFLRVCNKLCTQIGSFSEISLLKRNCLAQADFAVLGKWPTCAGSNKLYNFKLQIFTVRWKLTMVRFWQLSRRYRLHLGTH